MLAISINPDTAFQLIAGVASTVLSALLMMIKIPQSAYRGKLATSKQIDKDGTPDWRCGYGFQFWMCQHEGVYRGDGANGQYCIVIPDKDAVVAITSYEKKDLQGILDCVWEEILPQL